MKIVIENPKGSFRHWKDPGASDEKGKSYMAYAYGYVDDTTGADGEELDIYVGPCINSTNVFVVAQLKSPDFKEFDEYKCMVYFDTYEQARDAYLHQYTDPRFLGSIITITFDQFRRWIQDYKGSTNGLVLVRQPRLFIGTMKYSS